VGLSGPSPSRTQRITLPNGGQLDVPATWLRLPARGNGTIFQRPSDIGVGNGNQNSVRIMNPGAHPGYAAGYLRFYNRHGQPVDAGGKPGRNATTHFDLSSWSGHLPTGWPDQI
jgi:hypothetical protein